MTDDELLALFLDDDEEDSPEVTHAELSRLLHRIISSLGGNGGLSHDEIHIAVLRLIREIKRLRQTRQRVTQEHDGVASPQQMPKTVVRATDKGVDVTDESNASGWMRTTADPIPGRHAPVNATANEMGQRTDELTENDLDPLCDLAEGTASYDPDYHGTVLWKLIQDWRHLVAQNAALRDRLTSVAVYAERQAEHYEQARIGEARAWRHVQFQVEGTLAEEWEPPSGTRR